MPSQEQLFDFLHEISIELNNNGYHILNNIVHPFPKLKWEEEIIREMMNQRKLVTCWFFRLFYIR